MPTGDGLLIRLLPTDRIPVPAFVALCDAAHRHGNGTIEISARGNLQLRGFTEASAAAFARDVERLSIPADDGVPILTDPLPQDPDALIDATKLAAELRGAIKRARVSVAAKVCVVADGGGQLHLDAVTADIRLRAIPTLKGLRLHLAVAGDARSAIPLGSISPERASEVVLRLLAIIAQHGPVARARDCLTELASIAHDLGAESCVSSSRSPAEPIGMHPLRNGRFALGLAPAFGHAPVEAFSELARVVELNGASALRPVVDRALLLIDLDGAVAKQVAREAEALGFVTRADDARRRIVACPGSPACASGLIPARTLATEIAGRVRNVPGTIHISGCAKGCAHPAPAALTIVGTPEGCGILHHASARDAPSRRIDVADVIPEVIALASEERVHG
jgi:precorrin-3B synthase